MLPCRRGPARAAPARPEHRSHTQVAKFVAASVSRPGAELFGDASCPAGTAVRTHAVVRAGCCAVRRGVARARGNGPTRRSPAPPPPRTRLRRRRARRWWCGRTYGQWCLCVRRMLQVAAARSQPRCGRPGALRGSYSSGPRRRQPNLLEPCTAGDWSQLT